MPRIFKHLEAGCLQVNLMSTSDQINQLKHTILYYINNNNINNNNGPQLTNIPLPDEIIAIKQLAWDAPVIAADKASLWSSLPDSGNRTIRSQDNSPSRQLTPAWTIRSQVTSPQDNSPSGQIAPMTTRPHLWTIRSLDNSPSG